MNEKLKARYYSLKLNKKWEKKFTFNWMWNCTLNSKWLRDCKQMWNSMLIMNQSRIGSNWMCNQIPNQMCKWMWNGTWNWV